MSYFRIAAALLALSMPLAAVALPLNPDVREDTLQSTICQAGYTRTVRPSTTYTNGVKKKLMREAGLDPSLARDYELDHIIPLALGGSPRSIDNLMLQPWEGEDGAKKKDKLEVRLQKCVCAGALDLTEAQEAISADWQAASRRYSHLHCGKHRG